MASYEYDLFVIGAGSGGVRAARIAASHGAKVGLAEEYRYGGTCVIRGCIPKKLLVYASHVREELTGAAGFGWQVSGTFDWPTLIANKDTEIDRLNGIYRKLLDDRGVHLHDGRATLVDEHTVDVAGERHTARYILLAVGGRPFVPEFPGRELTITSNEAFQLPALPRRIVIVGGGYIACEFAAIFAGLGSEVVQLYRREQILRGFDEDLRSAVAANLRHHGVELRVHSNVATAQHADQRLTLTLEDGGELVADQLMCATGRTPNTGDLGLDALGVERDTRGAVVVDEFSRSSVANIYAVGDCTGRIELTPVAIREGHAVADTLFGNRPTTVDHEAVPAAVFTQPPAAFVGLTEAEARASGEVEVYRSTFRPLKHTLSGSPIKTMMKLIVDRASQRLLGVHMVGDDAPEIMQCMAIAVKMGATKQQLDATTALHPTAAEEFVLMREPLADQEG